MDRSAGRCGTERGASRRGPASAPAPAERSRGNIEKPPSGALRVTAHAGYDPVSKRRHHLSEAIPAGPTAERQARATRDRLLAEVAERRNPRAKATVDQLLSRYPDQFDGAGSTKTLHRSDSRVVNTTRVPAPASTSCWHTARIPAAASSGAGPIVRRRARWTAPPHGPPAPPGPRPGTRHTAGRLMHGSGHGDLPPESGRRHRAGPAAARHRRAQDERLGSRGDGGRWGRSAGCG